MENIGDFIVDKRLNVGYSMRRLSNELNINTPLWSDYEKNRKKIKLTKEQFNKLVEILKLNDNEIKYVEDKIK